MHLCTKFDQNRMMFRDGDSTIFKMAILNFRGPIVYSLKSPCRTSYSRQ